MDWQDKIIYKAGDVVIYKGEEWTCIQPHNSSVSWVPSIYTPTLWRKGASSNMKPSDYFVSFDVDLLKARFDNLIVKKITRD